MTIPEPAALLLSTLSINDPFSCGAEKLAQFLRKNEERWDPAQIIEPILSNEIDKKLQEYFIFCFLDISRSDLSTLNRALSLKRLSQLLTRTNNRLYPNDADENRIIDDLYTKTGVNCHATLSIASRICKNWAGIIADFGDIDNKSRIQFSSLLKCEASALRARTNSLADQVDSYNLKAIARLMPLLTICDEYAKSIDDLADMIVNRTSIGTPALTIKQIMRADSFDKILKSLSRSSKLSQFTKIIELQNRKLIPVPSLLAATTICRWLSDNEETPSQWVFTALELSSDQGLYIDAGSALSRIKPFLTNCGVDIDGTTLKIEFDTTPLSSLIGTDMLSRPPAIEKEVSLQDIVFRNMGNDVLLARLIDNPKVYNKPGFIEKIVNRSRSPAILQKIASTRALYTGQANTGVPAALLKNPTTIPISLLRMFINPRYVSLTSMKELLKNPYGIRREVYMEIKAFIERKR